MRRILFIIIMTLNYLIGMPLLLITLFIGLFSRNLKIHLAYTFNRYIGWCIFKIAQAKFDIEGIDNIPKDTNVLFVSNHTSMLDIPSLMLCSKKPIIFIGKKSVEKWPFISWWMRAMEVLFIDRSSARAGLETILAGIERLKDGETFAIYPEGTRSTGDELLPFKQGSLKLASKSGVPVVPVAIRGSADVFENNGFNIKPATVYMSIGKPILLSELSKEDQLKSGIYVQTIIQEMVNELIVKQNLTKQIL